MKTKYKLNIAGYPENAAKNFSTFKLAIITIISLFLTVALAVAVKGESGNAVMFDLVALALIIGYDILNVMAWIKKIQK